MDRKFWKEKVVDRTDWEPGPWDEEPDYYEWITKAGYEAFGSRMKTGAWGAYVIASHPTGFEFHKFMNALVHDLLHPVGMVVKTDNPNLGRFGISFEHWKSPGKTDRTWFMGEYRTLKDLIATCESLANDLLKLNQDPSLYLNSHPY